MTCNSIFCIYVLKCKCGLIYIGECENFRARINLHVNQIAKPEYRKLYVSKHIFGCGQKFTAAPIFLMPDEALINRKVKEEHFIHLLKPELNR